jgi:hypothetical protein
VEINATNARNAINAINEIFGVISGLSQVARRGSASYAPGIAMKSKKSGNY